MIKLRGAKLHNLKNVDADFPKGEITVVCGPSGCGKSTLVLDTLHGECKRRYLETISPFAAELLGGRRVIPLDSAEGLPASIAIGPSRGEAPAKSYALSIAECDSALRTIFARFANPACPVCGEPMRWKSREQIIRDIAGMELGTKLQFLAEIPVQGNNLDKLAALFLAQGFTRAIADGVIYSLADLTLEEKKLKPESFFIVVDRIIIRENTRTRIAEAVDGVLKLTHAKITLDVNGKQEIFSTQPFCRNSTDKRHKKAGTADSPRVLEASSFSPYSRLFACPECAGKGMDEEEKSCPKCGGLRLDAEVLNAGVDVPEGSSLLKKHGTTFTWKDFLGTSFNELPVVLEELFQNRIGQNLVPTLKTLQDRIQAIQELGIGYLTLGRAGTTLSGGEMQRLRLASLSTGHLNGLLVCLDEPASGLHKNDVDKLWNVLKKIQSRGNTLVLIEHNPEIIQRADRIIEMGPGAGEKGGEILFQGERDSVLKEQNSPTANWLKELSTGKAAKAAAASAKSAAALAKSASKCKCISVQDFAMYDMDAVSAEFPLNKFSVITGQSGSGKSTLLFENIAKRAEEGEFQSLGIDALSVLTTGDFHGSRRSSVASAINLTTLLRDLFAKMPESKVRGYGAAKFSTHAPGGRCENCKGEGVIFDPSGYEETECPVCQGRRFRDEILEVRFKSLSIADILDMEVGAAYKLFSAMKPFADKLKPLVDTGLDYLRLGQSTAHLSGGERARLRLSIALARAKAPNTLFLFDEPARGLHKKDITLLLDLIRGLCEAGHTVIAIEHAQDFINAADYVLELKRSSH